MCVLAFSMRRAFASDQRVNLAISSSWSLSWEGLADKRSLSSSRGLRDPIKEFAGNVTLKSWR